MKLGGEVVKTSSRPKQRGEFADVGSIPYFGGFTQGVRMSFEASSRIWELELSLIHI